MQVIKSDGTTEPTVNFEPVEDMAQFRRADVSALMSVNQFEMTHNGPNNMFVYLSVPVFSISCDLSSVRAIARNEPERIVEETKTLGDISLESGHRDDLPVELEAIYSAANRPSALHNCAIFTSTMHAALAANQMSLFVNKFFPIR